MRMNLNINSKDWWKRFWQLQRKFRMLLFHHSFVCFLRYMYLYMWMYNVRHIQSTYTFTKIYYNKPCSMQKLHKKPEHHWKDKKKINMLNSKAVDCLTAFNRSSDMKWKQTFNSNSKEYITYIRLTHSKKKQKYVKKHLNIWRAYYFLWFDVIISNDLLCVIHIIFLYILKTRINL